MPSGLRELVKNQTAWPVLNSQLAVVAAGVILARAILTATLGRRPGHSPEWPIRRF